MVAYNPLVEPLTAQKLIIQAFYLINVNYPNEIPEGYEITEALSYLNQELDVLSAEGVTIPYFSYLNFDLIPSQDKYVIGFVTNADVEAPKIVTLENAFIRNSNNQLENLYITDFGQQNKIKLAFNNTQSAMPEYIFLQNTPYYSELYFTPVPDKAYSIELTAKQVLTNVILCQRLNEVPAFYIKFLRYSLARCLAPIFSKEISPDIEKEYQNLLKLVKDVSDVDMTLDSVDIFTYRRRGLYACYPFINW